MPRELNRDLFQTTGHAVGHEANTPAQPVAYAKADEVRVLHLHIEALNKRLKEFESRLETMTAKVDDVMKQTKVRFERVQGHFQRQNEILKNGFNDSNNKIAQVASRVNERRVEENVVKEMIERHTQVVQGFEVRLQQLQRLISEQEMQLMSARSELKEMRSKR